MTAAASPWADAHSGLLVWAVMTAVVALLALLGWHFRRRTLRRVTAVLALVVATLLTAWGAPNADTFWPALLEGLDKAVDGFFAPLGGTWPAADAASRWVFLALLVVLYWLLEAWSARFETPSVEVADPDVERPQNGQPAPREVADAWDLTRELRFRLPGIDVRRPSLMPGGTTADSLAAVVGTAPLLGKEKDFWASLLKLLGRMWPSPPALAVNIRCEPDDHGSMRTSDGLRKITVDVRDVHTGQSRLMKTLSYQGDEGAETAAGFAARTAFRTDLSAPRWSVGSFDGADLAAYLMFMQRSAAARTIPHARQAWHRQADDLERAVANSPGAGVVRYELALLEDLLGRYEQALYLHATNVAQYPRFYRARYRLAQSLAMVAGPGFAEYWGRLDRLSRRNVVRNLRECGLPAPGADPRLDAALDADLPDRLQRQLIRREFLKAADRHFTAYGRLMRLPWLAWRCLLHRDERTGWESFLRPTQLARRHRAAVRDATRVAGWLVRARLILLDDRPDYGEIADLLDSVDNEMPGSYPRKPGHLSWFRKQPSWAAAYDAACLYAATLSTPCAEDRRGRRAHVERVVELLQRVVDDPDCEMERPSDWLLSDPDLDPVRDETSFQQFLLRQIPRDYPYMEKADIEEEVVSWRAGASHRPYAMPVMSGAN